MSQNHIIEKFSRTFKIIQKLRRTSALSKIHPRERSQIYCQIYLRKYYSRENYITGGGQDRADDGLECA